MLLIYIAMTFFSVAQYTITCNYLKFENCAITLRETSNIVESVERKFFFSKKVKCTTKGSIRILYVLLKKLIRKFKIKNSETHFFKI